MIPLLRLSLIILGSLVSGGCWSATTASNFLNTLCERGFDKTTMPSAEVARFCNCMMRDIQPRLTPAQQSYLSDVDSRLKRGISVSKEALAVSGVRDLVVEAQARCEAAFYPPSEPLSITGGELRLYLNCDDEEQDVRILISIAGSLIAKDELKLLTKRLLVRADDSWPTATVQQSFDGKTSGSESWSIGLSGDSVHPETPRRLLETLRSTKPYKVIVRRGQQQFSGSFDLATHLPPRWQPCGGIIAAEKK